MPRVPRWWNRRGAVTRCLASRRGETCKWHLAYQPLPLYGSKMEPRMQQDGTRGREPEESRALLIPCPRQPLGWIHHCTTGASIPVEQCALQLTQNAMHHRVQPVYLHKWRVTKQHGLCRRPSAVQLRVGGEQNRMSPGVGKKLFQRQEGGHC